MTSRVDASSRSGSDCMFRTGGEVVGPTGAGEHDAGAHLAATRRQQPALCCVSLLPSANLRGTRVHIVRRHTAELHASDQKHKEKKNRKKKGFPSSQGNHDMKQWSCQRPLKPKHRTQKNKKKPRTCLKASRSCVCLTVSHSFDLIQSDTLREYFSPRHPKAI